MSENPWVELERATNIAEAEVIRSFLQSHGIDVIIPDEHSARTMHYLTPMMGFVRIQVRQDDMSRAQLELKKMRITIAEEHVAEPYSSTQQGDDLSLRASRTAIFGLMMVPLVLNIYSVFVMWECFQKKLTLSGKGKRHLIVAAIFNALSIVGWGSFIYNGGALNMLKHLLGVTV